MKLSIIIPAYNEEKRIKPTLNSYYNFFKNKLGKNFELIIIPNNSEDKTLEIAQNFAKSRKNIRVYNISRYVGKGGAVMKGFEIAKGDLVGFTDADNSTNPENFFKLYQNIKDNDGIIASRKVKGACISPRRRFTQEISSFLFNKSVILLYGLKYGDTQCGAKLFTRKTANLLIKEYTEHGWIFDVDLLYISKRNNLKIKEYPILWTDCAGGKVTLSEGIRSFLYLIKYRIATLFKYPNR
jgi:glycosyltransferase involved in cell wall biosynthesis